MEDWSQEFSPDNNGDIDDIRPKKGMEFDSVQAAWEFWCKYGRKMGFGVRKSRRGNDTRDVKEPRPETRTNCLARMGTKLTRATGKYAVHDFVGEHNHELLLSGWVHMKRSQTKSTDARALEAELASDARPTPNDSVSLFKTRLGGRENIRLMKLEQKNYLPCKRQRDMEFGEAGFLMKYFQTKTLEDPSFFFAVQMDNDEQITNVIWADARMRIDYALFGEALAFDTTFATDEDYRPLGVFVGFNHHRQVVIFGAALLYDETAESFQWLFETFLEAHG
ncbi:FAR1-RELATED SEQUENCE 5-like protein [Drosera capensis]